MNVTEHPDGFLVRVKSAGTEHRRWIPRGRGARAKAAAIGAQLRSELPRKEPRFTPRSNTGHLGITLRRRGDYTVALGKGKNTSASTLKEALRIRRAWERANRRNN